MNCSYGSSGGSDFDNVDISDSLEELLLLNGEHRLMLSIE